MQATSTKEATDMLNPTGLCQCGCGMPAPIATKTITSKGRTKGQPLRFIRGHNSRASFWDHVPVERGAGCWKWMGSYHADGYGQHNRILAHRLVYEAMVGSIPAGKELHHMCEHRWCVNPAHLAAVTRREHNGAHNATRTHCKHGHLFDESNTYYAKGGKRRCRACNRDWMRRYQARLRSA